MGDTAEDGIPKLEDDSKGNLIWKPPNLRSKENKDGQNNIQGLEGPLRWGGGSPAWWEWGGVRCEEREKQKQSVKRYWQDFLRPASGSNP